MLNSRINERGALHLLVPLILLVGIGAGVVLATSDNISGLFSNASGQQASVEFVDSGGNPISSTTSKNVKLKLTYSSGASPSPTPMPGSCGADSVWNGSICKRITMQGETAVVGLDAPVATRAELDEIEKSFVKRSFSNFPEDLFNPTIQSQGQQIQEARLNNMRQIGSDFERTWEFLINSSAKSAIDQNTTVGGDALATLVKHADAANVIYTNSSPKINRKVVLKRIIIVSDSLLSVAGGSWQVVNDHNFGWWANDRLNGSRGFIPFDIDSRWALDDNWPGCCLFNRTQTYQGVKIDYSLIHELTHHFPVGDNYVYNMGSGHGFFIAQPDGKSARFRYNDIDFMNNDHMTSPTSQKLTAPSSYAIRFIWLKNLQHRRSSQDFGISTEIPVYGNFYFDSLTIKLAGLGSSGVTGCDYLLQGAIPTDPNQLVNVAPSASRSSINFSNGECTLVLNRSQQNDAYPGAYIGLQKSGVIFPVYIPRVLMETLYWSRSLAGNPPSSFTYTLNATSELGGAIDYYVSRIQSGSGDVNLAPSKIVTYMDLVGSTNQYFYEYRYPGKDSSNVILASAIDEGVVIPVQGASVNEIPLIEFLKGLIKDLISKIQTPVLAVDNFQRVFVTSATYSGNLGGLSGADQKCQERANAASLGGTWKAWISNSTISAASRLIHAESPYQLVNGTVVASNWADLTDGSLAAPININENNTLIEAFDTPSVWTNTNADGSLFSTNLSDTCQDWNATPGGTYTGYLAATNSSWSHSGGYPSCSNSLRLYCFEEVITPTPTPTPTLTPELFPTHFRVASDQTGLTSAQEQLFDQNGKIIDWTLTDGGGVKTVYAQFKLNEVWTEAVSASITYNPPTPSPTPTPQPSPTPSTGWVALKGVADNSLIRGTKNITITPTTIVTGAISNTELLVNNVIVGSDSTSPYVVSWNTKLGNDGQKTLSAYAYNTSGTTYASTAISVTVDNTVPTLTIDTPSANAVVSGQVLIKASATDLNGIKNVKFFVDGVLKTTLTSLSYEYSWPSGTVLNGQHSLRVTATDKAGNTTPKTVKVFTIN